MRRFFALVALTSFVFLASRLPLEAADVTGTITGVVKDASGAVIPGVLVTGTHTGTNATYTATSDETGTYALRGIPVGVYKIVTEHTGFKPFELTGIRLQVNESLRVDVALVVGATTDRITVSADVISVDTVSPTLKAVIDQRRIEDLPLNGRNPTQLMRLVAGVEIDTRSDVTSGQTYPGVTPVSVNGGRSNATNYILDGGQNNDHYNNAPNPMPNPDALQEFSVQTNNFSAEFGRNVGGVVNAVTKSGTNQVHGSAFEYLRNYSMNAANFFALVKAPGVKQDDGLKRNQFGASMGGPVWFPRIYNGKNKTFFFFAYQGQRQRRTPTTTNVTVPTLLQRAGDFSEVKKALKDPFGGGVYPGNRIPLSQYDTAAKWIVDHYVPAPAPGANQIAYSARRQQDEDQTMAKIDHQLTANNRLSGRYWVSKATAPAMLDPANYMNTSTGSAWRNTSTVLSDTHVFSPTLVNTALVGFNQSTTDTFRALPEKSLADLGIKIYSDKKPQYHMTISGYFSINTGDTNFFLRDEYQLSDTLRWSHGKHQISIGAEYDRGLGNIDNNYRANGIWNWNSSAPFTGDALADYFVGKFTSLAQGVGEYKRTRFNMFSTFFQDSAKVSRRLTLNLGVRWEPHFPWKDRDGKLAGWREGQQSTRYVNAPRGILYPGDPGFPEGGYNTAWKNFGPRVGFSWDVFGDGKSSIRGGYGVFFDSINTIQSNSLANQGPFGTVVNILGNTLNNFSNPYAGTTNPFPASTNPPREVKFFLPLVPTLFEEHMRNPYLQSWNLTVEREIGWATVIKAGYAGSKGTRLYSGREFNPAIYRPGATTSNLDQRRPRYPELGQTNMIQYTGNSVYHSLQTTLEKRFQSGFSLLASYTFSRSIDDGSNNKGNGTTMTNPWNQRADRGRSDFDHAHVLTASGLWEIPYKPSAAVTRFLAGGWKLTGILTLQTGYHFDIGSGVNNFLTGGGNRADVIGDWRLPEDRTRGQRVLQWLNKAAFGPNALGTPGNIGRNVLPGPGTANIDLGLHKDFRMKEYLTAQFRFESFNSFNRVNLNLPTTSLNSANFMRVTSAGDPRILQFALRLMW